MAQNRPFNQIPVYPVLIDVEWMEKHRNEHRNLSCYVDGVKWSTKFSVMFCYFGFSRLHKKKNERKVHFYLFLVVFNVTH